MLQNAFLCGCTTNDQGPNLNIYQGGAKIFEARQSRIDPPKAGPYKSYVPTGVARKFWLGDPNLRKICVVVMVTFSVTYC